jgi:hypothetical protein
MPEPTVETYRVTVRPPDGSPYTLTVAKPTYGMASGFFVQIASRNALDASERAAKHCGVSLTCVRAERGPDLPYGCVDLV